MRKFIYKQMYALYNVFIRGRDLVKKVLKGYKFRMYSNNEQKILVEKNFGCSRYIYNYFLTYKSNWLGKKCYQIDIYYPSSQICPHCGYKNSKLKHLIIRKWECKEWHNENERDLNTSINIIVDV